MRRFETSRMRGNPASKPRGAIPTARSGTQKYGAARGDPKVIPRGRGDPGG